MKVIGTFFNNIFRAWKNEFRLVIRDKGVIIFLFLVPLLYPIVYALIYDTELSRDVPVVVVDLSRSSKSRDLARRIDASESAKVIGYAANMDEAREALAEKSCYGIVLIDRNFDRDIGRGEQGNVTLFCDMSLLIRYKSLLLALTDATMDLGSDIRVETMSRLGASAPSVPATVSSAYFPLGNPEQGFATFLLPGIIVLVVQQTLLLSICMLGGAIYERRRANGGIDTADTLGSCPVSRLVGKSVAYMMLYIGQFVFLLYIVPYIFNYPQTGSMWDIFLLGLPYMLAVVFLGLALQVFVRERESVFLLIVFSSVPMLLLSGILWPMFAMDKWLQVLSGCIPSTWAMQAFVRINANAATLADVGFEYKMLWLLAGFYFLVALAVNMFSSRRRSCR